MAYRTQGITTRLRELARIGQHKGWASLVPLLIAAAALAGGTLATAASATRDNTLRCDRRDGAVECQLENESPFGRPYLEWAGRVEGARYDPSWGGDGCFVVDVHVPRTRDTVRERCVFEAAPQYFYSPLHFEWARLQALVDGEDDGKLEIASPSFLAPPRNVGWRLAALAVAALAALYVLVQTIRRSRQVTLELDDARLELHRVQQWLGGRRTVGVSRVGGLRRVRVAPGDTPAIELLFDHGVERILLPDEAAPDEIARLVERELLRERRAD